MKLTRFLFLATIFTVTFEKIHWDVAGQIYLVRGRTQPGNTVRCAGRETLAARDGFFQLQINAPRGAREVQLETADTQGNRNSFKFQLPPGG